MYCGEGINAWFAVTTIERILAIVSNTIISVSSDDKTFLSNNSVLILYGQSFSSNKESLIILFTFSLSLIEVPYKFDLPITASYSWASNEKDVLRYCPKTQW